jgi:hypothetical protein
MEYPSKLVGVSFNNRQINLKNVVEGQELFFKHEKNNPHDENAVLVYADAEMTKELGHLNRKMAKKVCQRIATGVPQQIFAKQRTGEDYPKRFGLNIRVVFES